jgi:hypothetical protein
MVDSIVTIFAAAAGSDILGRRDGNESDARRVSMDEAQVHTQIERLVEEEHALWKDEAEGGSSEQDGKRLKEVQVMLDQCWDLLRQRRALREAQLDPDGASVRQPEVVEHYEQ